MTFAQLLRQYIGRRTLEEMSTLCAEKGLALDPTYISKLRTGNRPPPDDAQTIRVLAEACGGDPYRLLFAADMERNPGFVLEVVLDTLSGGDPDTAPATMDELRDRLNGLPPALNPRDMAVTVIIGSGNKVIAQFTQPFRAP